MSNLYEASCYRGTESWVLDEIRQTKGLRVVEQGGGAIRFESKGGRLSPVKAARLVLPTAVYESLTFAVPRPKALLGDQNFRLLIQTISEMIEAYGRSAFHTIGLEAAGRDSAVMRRLHDELAARLRLATTDEAGDVNLRLRPAPGRRDGGWEVLVRQGARPHATRSWRVANMAGALNGPVAALMNRLAIWGAADRVLNVGCGSATLLIEHEPLARPPLGGDIRPEALVLARQNLAAAGQAAELVQFDGGALPFPAASWDVITADLPWGQLVGSSGDNDAFYPLFVREAHRLLKQGGRMAVLTHDVRRFEAAVREMSGLVALHDVTIEMGRATPRLLVHQRQN